MPWIGGALAGAGSLFGGLFGSSSASSAANAQSAATQKAIEAEQGFFNTIKQQLAPFLQYGTDANNILASVYFGLDKDTGGINPNAPFLQPITSFVGQPPDPNDPTLRNKFLASPGYQYQLGQMMDATQNSAAGRSE